jgi:hypothetical protein
MRLKRSLLLGAAGLTLLLTAPPPARAGGAAFTFDPRAYAPGQRVLGRASFDPTVKGNGRLEDGPFYAYLLPLNEAIPPLAIPDRGVLLGRIAMGMSGLGSAIATISFVMPDVRPGTYVIEPCDDPCRRDIVGDFVGGTIEVVRTPELALIENVRIALRPDLDEATARVRANLASGIADTHSRPGGGGGTPANAGRADEQVAVPGRSTHLEGLWLIVVGRHERVGCRRGNHPGCGAAPARTAQPRDRCD